MKNLIKVLAAIFIMCTPAASAQSSLRDILGALGGGSSSSDTGNGSAAADAIANLISGFTGGKQLEVADLAGVWKYREPAVSFESDNLLKKAGGAAMAAVIVNKIKPYYDKVNLSELQVTLRPDSTFQFALGRLKLSGTFARNTEKPDANYFIFKFKALGNISLGQIDADIQKSGQKLTMTFDADKLITLLNMVAKFTGRKSIQAAASLLNSYEGLNCGFALDKTGEVEGSVPASVPADDTPAPATDSTARQNSGQNALGGLLDMLRKRN